MKVCSMMAGTIALAFGIGTAAHAQSAGNLLGAPVVAGGNLITGAAGTHAAIAPIVNRAAPTAEPLTDGVTNAIGAAGNGVALTGAEAQTNGVRVGSTASGRPIASVGATQPGNQGTVAALLNGRP